MGLEEEEEEEEDKEDKDELEDNDDELDDEEEEEPEDEDDESSDFFPWGLFSSTSKYPTGPCCVVGTVGTLLSGSKS